MAGIVAMLGPASMAMHAAQTEVGGRLDVLSMYLIASFAAAYSLMRVFRWKTTGFAATFALLVATCELVERVPVTVPLVQTPGNTIFAGLLVLALALELTARAERRWGYACVGSLLLAFAIWIPPQTGTRLCDPHSVLQGHAAWHLLCAVAAYCLYRYYLDQARRPAHG